MDDLFPLRLYRVSKAPYVFFLIYLGFVMFYIRRLHRLGKNVIGFRRTETKRICILELTIFERWEARRNTFERTWPC